jgi:hypothetical protein
MTEQLGKIHITPRAKEIVDRSGEPWEKIWPRHLKALQPGKSVFTLLDLPNGDMLAIATTRGHDETMVGAMEEMMPARGNLHQPA